MQKTYEELIAELKEILRTIEDNDTGLEESIALFKRGEALISECERLLAEAELTISTLTQE
jgi:exodeoxyribonuclease VII small subunit